MIVVMGAAGNVGRRLSDRLLGEGQPVRVLEHRRSLEELGRRGAEVVTGDLGDAGASACCSRTPRRPWYCSPTW